MPQNTNLNVSPYFDDFDSSKNFNKVLFKPGNPIQARELTTLQSILQGQIEKFGKHFFKEGSMIIPGVFKYDGQYTSVKVESTFFGVPVELYYDKLVGLRIQGKTTGVIAQVVKVLSAAASETNHTTLYIKYEKDSDNYLAGTFLDGETLTTLEDLTYGLTTITNGSDFATAINSNATNVGSAFAITRGVWFVRGSFVEVSPETIILNQYEPFASFRVGLNVKEEIVTAVDDNSLYDNAAGFSNYTAPGADRFKLSVSLIKKELDDYQDENFIELQRIQEGITVKIVDTTIYSELAKEFARRTFDESGNYYVDKFDIEAKECLNDRVDVFGTFFPEQITDQGNVPTKDLMNIRIGPGKAYVRGYEVKTHGSRHIDVDKPRTTRLVESSAVPFEAGNKLRLNNVLNGAQIKLSAINSDYVSLQKERLGSTRSSALTEIGRARIYDFKLQNAGYTGDVSVFELMLLDIQTDVSLTINQSHTIALPAVIEGASSGARGFLKSGVSGSTTVVLNQVAGKFLTNEQLIINGERNGRIITGITEFDLSDVKSVRSTAASRTFAADVVLETKKDLTGRSFSITSGGVVTSGTAGWTKNFKVGDVISYKRGGVTDVTFNVVSAVSATNNNVTVVAAPNTVSGVCHKALPSSTITVSDLKIVSGKIKSSKSGFLYAELPNKGIESVDLTDSLLQVRVEDTGLSTNGSGQLTMPSLTGTDFVYAPFDEERYTVIYNDGSIETLTTDQVTLTTGAKGVTISGLTASQSNNVVVHSTQQKSKVKSKVKNLTRSATLIVSGSNRSNSGITTGLRDGLTFASPFGKRVQDREISLDVPDVVSVAAVFESSGNTDPTIPQLTLGSYNGPNANNSDVILGEIGIGVSSGGAAMILGRSSTTKVDVIFKNNKPFVEGEEVKFQESGVRAVLSSVEPGDNNIRANYRLDTGQRSEFYDFGRLVRKQGFPEPQGRLKIYFDHYVINSEDSGDVITASSYDANEYDTVPIFDEIRNTDVVDFRPRVAPYSGSRSPFEFDSRDFSGAGQAARVLVSDENITFDYKHYLPRIDRLYIQRNGNFIIKQGEPAVKPVQPEAIPNAFELARIEYPPYVFDAKREVKVIFRGNQRYTMKDIGALETRIEKLEDSTTLSLLESKTESLVITDPTTGLDRFKNGFVVDPFNTFGVADKTVPFLKYDIDEGKLVSRKYSDSIDLLVGSNSVVGTNGAPDLSVDPRYVTDFGNPNVKKTGDLITLDYDEVVERVQPFATRVENVNPYMIRSWAGNLALNPDSDVFIVNEAQQLGDFLSLSDGTDLIVTERDIPDMREQNIEFVATRLKPGTNHYISFAGVDMIENRNNVIPKLLEVTPVTGAFQIGETVSGLIPDANGGTDQVVFRFRLATPNHKDGPFNSPTVVFDNNPYEANVGLSSSYSETSTVLNIDTKSLSQMSDPNFFGFVQEDMILVGESSGAGAQINQLRLISDDKGALVGCLHIEEGQFINGTNTALVSSLRPTDPQTPGINFSRASADHFSEGTLVTDNTLVKIEPEPVIPVINFITNITQNITNITNILSQQEEDDDPLAQTFQVDQSDGIFITSVDLFFATKSETIPLELRVVDVVNGYPSRNVRKHSIVVKNPSEVNVSSDASLPTTFTFRSPVYLPQGEYAFVVITATSDYNQWICQIGEEDISTADQPELGKVIVTKQPTLGSLFKGQTAGTWTPSQLEDMKYTLRRAKFTTNPGAVNFYNPALNIFDTRNKLPDNPIETFSRRVVVGLTSSIATGTDIGSVITQTSNSDASGIVAEKLSHLSQAGNTLSVTNSGTGYEDATYSSVSLVALTGRGTGAVGVVTVSSGQITGVTVKGSNTGSGYQVGDILTAALGVKGLGQDLKITVGVTTAANALVLTNGTGTFDTTNTIISDGTTLPNIIPATVTTNTDQYDGSHFKVSHPNHCNHAVNNTVTIADVTGDSVSTKITVGYGVSETSVVSVASSIGFSFFEGEQVTASNPGYAMIGNEIIEYTSVGVNQLSGTITRGIDNSLPRTYSVGAPIQKYELSGVSLRKINKTHSLINVTSGIEDRVTLDSYHVKIDGTKFFSKDKFGGGVKARATKNIMFDAITPTVSHSLPPGTDINASVRTITATSVSGGENSFVDTGFTNLSLVNETVFTETRMVASVANEDAQLSQLPANKSFMLQVSMNTNNEDLSPVIDAFKSNITTRSSRINSPVGDYASSGRVNKVDDPHENIYQTKVIKLDTPASSLKVKVAAMRPASADIRCLYRLQRADGDEIDKVFELMPGFDNLDAAGFVINPNNNNGKADTNVVASLEDQFLEYEFTQDDLPLFTGFQVKIVISSTNQATPAELLDFQAIAVA